MVAVDGKARTSLLRFRCWKQSRYRQMTQMTMSFFELFFIVFLFPTYALLCSSLQDRIELKRGDFIEVEVSQYPIPTVCKSSVAWTQW